MAEQATAMARAAAFDVDRRLEAATILQELLTDVIDLSLQGKQAHWNIRGPMFRSLHLQLDELVDATHQYSDELAERCLALGVAADGRAASVVKNTHLDPFPEGRVEDRQVVELLVARLRTASEVGRSRLEKLGEVDPVSQDLANGVLEGLEKHLWMFEAHRPETGH